MPHIFIAAPSAPLVLSGHPLPRYCRLYADALPPLHAFAASVGVSRALFVDSPWALPYYALPLSRRRQALALGAAPISDEEVTLLWQFWKSKKRLERSLDKPEGLGQLVPP